MDFSSLQEERRRLPRARAYIPVSYRLKFERKVSATLSRDISEGGLKLLAEDYFPANTDFVLEINLPKVYKLIRVVARTTWALRIPHSDRYQLGLKFIEINENYKKYVSEYINMLNTWPSLGLV